MREQRRVRLTEDHVLVVSQIRQAGERSMPPHDGSQIAEARTPAVLEGDSFTACLNRHLQRSGLSLSALARRSWLDISYVSRLVHLPCDPLNPRLHDRGDKRRPSRDTVIRLGLAMRLSLEDMDELLLTAGYAPLVR